MKCQKIVQLNVVIYAIIYNVIMLSVISMIGIILNVVMLNVMGPI